MSIIHKRFQVVLNLFNAFENARFVVRGDSLMILDISGSFFMHAFPLDSFMIFVRFSLTSFYRTVLGV